MRVLVLGATAEVTDEQLAGVNITRHACHGEWDYTIAPSETTS